MTTVVSFINMKGGVGKTTLAFNIAWYCAFYRIKVLAIDLDPQANLSQYCMGPVKYLEYLVENKQITVVNIFEDSAAQKADYYSDPYDWRRCIYRSEGIDLIPSKLELSKTLKNPTNKAHLLSEFIESISEEYDLIIIDCAPTDSILTTAAYHASQYIIVPVKPEFLGTIGLPLLARSLNEYRQDYPHKKIYIAGIIFNGKSRSNPSPEETQAYEETQRLAHNYGWRIFESEIYHSRSYSKGSRSSQSIYRTSHTREDVTDEFGKLGREFLYYFKLRK